MYLMFEVEMQITYIVSVSWYFVTGNTESSKVIIFKAVIPHSFQRSLTSCQQPSVTVQMTQDDCAGVFLQIQYTL